MQTATLANGCFWCTEAIFQKLKGVTSVQPGYCGGHIANPTYQQVSSGSTGHAECIQIQFDPNAISYKTILEIFFHTHDPTTLNQQGADVGTQYRSAIFYHTPEQQQIAQAIIHELNTSGAFSAPIVTEITQFTEFYPAEDYHQNFYNRNRNSPYCRIVIDPKIQKLIKTYSNQLT
jgi:peptide-methionine (S)-S-oxide reductase